MDQIEITEFEIPDLCKLITPRNWRSDPDATYCLFRLYSETLMGSGVFVDLLAPIPHSDVVEEGLLDATEEFINSGILPSTKQNNQLISNIRSESQVDGTFVQVDTKVEIDDAVLWFIRIVYDSHKRLGFILHYNGPREEVLKIAVPIMDSFCIL